MGGRRIAAIAASPRLRTLAVVALAASGERGSERRGERGGRGRRRAGVATPPRPCASSTIALATWIERGRERERALGTMSTIARVLHLPSP